MVRRMSEMIRRSQIIFLRKPVQEPKQLVSPSIHSSRTDLLFLTILLVSGQGSRVRDRSHPCCSSLPTLFLRQLLGSILQLAPSRPPQNERIRCNNCYSTVPLRQLLRPTLRMTPKHPPQRLRIHYNVYCTIIPLGLCLIRKHNPVLFGRTMQALG